MQAIVLLTESSSTELYILFRQAFQMFDSNHDGFIDMKELRQVTTKEEVDEFMEKADKVGNENVKHE